MKAMVYDRFGPPDVLKLKELQIPVPGENEVLLKIHAASINSWDWDLLRGKPVLSRIDGGVFRPGHRILGCDVAGTVMTAGAGVVRLKPGDEVFGDLSGGGWGGFAEYACASADMLALKPPRLSFQQAAAIPQAAVLALQGLRFAGELSHGQSLLINGAGGGVGTFAVQMARHLGAEVTGVDRGIKLDTLNSLGADYVIDYTREDFTRGGRRYDKIIDVTAVRSPFEYRRSLNPGGVAAVIGGTTGSIFATLLLGPLAGKAGRNRIGLVLHRPNLGDLEYCTELWGKGKVVPVIDTVFPLSEAAEAFCRFGTGDAIGKIVITMDES